MNAVTQEQADKQTNKSIMVVIMSSASAQMVATFCATTDVGTSWALDFAEPAAAMVEALLG